MSSSANVTPSNIILSPMRVKFNGVDLGGTDGGVEFSASTKTADIKTDQTGDEAISSVVMASMYEVKMTLAEVKKKENWKVAFPFAKLVTSGQQKAIHLENVTGQDLLQYGQQLLLHPLQNDDAVLDEDILCYKAVPVAASQVKFEHGKQAGLQLTFKIYMDTSTTPARYVHFGDPAVAAVAASLTQQGFVGTGNGTASGLSAGSKAVTESITATCIKASADGGIFEVIGGVSGALGNARVGVAFTSQYANFTINDGAVDFVEGDVFTFSSVAANY